MTKPEGYAGCWFVVDGSWHHALGAAAGTRVLAADGTVNVLTAHCRRVTVEAKTTATVDDDCEADGVPGLVCPVCFDFREVVLRALRAEDAIAEYGRSMTEAVTKATAAHGLAAVQLAQPQPLAEPALPKPPSLLPLQTTATTLCAEGRAVGIENVIVLVGMNDGKHYTRWSGSGLALRGLAELGLDTIRAACAEARQPRASGTFIVGGGGSGGAGGGVSAGKTSFTATIEPGKGEAKP